MLRLLIPQTIQLLVAVWGISLIVFMVNFVIGDPLTGLISPETPEETRQILRHQYGFDRPVLVQYFDFARRAAVGDFGDSYIIKKPAIDLVFERVPATLQLALVGMGIGILIAIPVGIISAYRPYSLIDNIATIIAVAGQAMPIYWLGLMLILLLSVQFQLLPASGYGTPQHIILPAFCLGVFTAPIAMRLIRSGMLDVLSQDYVRTARAKGLSERLTLRRHALKNAAIPLVTLIGLDLPRFLSGAIVVESIFAWPGMGRLFWEHAEKTDIPVLMAVMLFTSILVVLCNLLADVGYAYLDPRIRYR